VDKYQRYSKEWNQVVRIRSVKAKTFKEGGEVIGTSSSTVIRRFKEVAKDHIASGVRLPKIIAIDEYKGDTDAGTYQLIIADCFHYCRYIYFAIDEVRRKAQKEWHAYDRKKCKRMLYKRSEKLTEKNRLYLDRYLRMSEELLKAYELKEAYCKWFDWAKTTEDVAEVKRRLEAFYRKVEETNILVF
jgi:transposase